MNELTLELKGITKSYLAGTPGQVDVLRGADLALQAGEVVALVAPSGAGKSTLLHIAGLLDTPDAGEVRVAGEDITRKGDRRRTRVRRQEVGFGLPVPPLAAGIHRAGKHCASATGQWRGAKGSGGAGS